MRRLLDGCKGVGRPIRPENSSSRGGGTVCPSHLPRPLGRVQAARRLSLSQCSGIVAYRRRIWHKPVGLAGALHACRGSDVEQSFGAHASSRTMMSTHCSLLMRAGLSRTTPMTSAFFSASIFGAGLILGYALRAWRVQGRGANSLYGAARQTSQPTSTFGHARRAF